MEIHDLVCILGPTATGKTKTAVNLANKIEGEIIGADSRQVYKGLDIGTGKDLDEYTQNGITTPFHLIDILDPMENFNVFQFKKATLDKCIEIQERKKTPIICGGTGLYIEAFILNYTFNPAVPDEELRKNLEELSTPKLAEMLDKYRPDLTSEDRNNRHRVIRALEIELTEQNTEKEFTDYNINNLNVFGINLDRSIVRQKISNRLKARLEEGMIDEIKNLIDSGVSTDWLCKLGLEYKYVTLYLTKKIDREEMFHELETAIHRFAKRQMTWFRRMEKRGIKINWIDGNLSEDEKTKQIIDIINQR